MDNDIANVEKTEKMLSQKRISFDPVGFQLMPCFQSDDAVDHRQFGKILELVFRIPGSVAGQNPLPMHRLGELFKHDDRIHRTRHPKAIAPGHRDIQKGDIFPILSNSVVHPRNAQVNRRQRDGQMFESQKDNQGGNRQGKVLSFVGSNVSQPGKHAKSHQNCQPHHDHDTDTARITVSVENRKSLQNLEWQRYAQACPIKMSHRSPGQHQEYGSCQAPKTDHSTMSPMKKPPERKSQCHIAQKKVLALIMREVKMVDHIPQQRMQLGRYHQPQHVAGKRLGKAGSFNEEIPFDH